MTANVTELVSGFVFFEVLEESTDHMNMLTIFGSVSFKQIPLQMFRS